MPIAVCADRAYRRLAELGIAPRVIALRYTWQAPEDGDPQQLAREYGRRVADSLGLGPQDAERFGPGEKPYNFERALGALWLEVSTEPPNATAFRGAGHKTFVQEVSGYLQMKQVPTGHRRHLVPGDEARSMAVPRAQDRELLGLGMRYFERSRPGRSAVATVRANCRSQREAYSRQVLDSVPRVALPGKEPRVLGEPGRRQYYIHLRGPRLHFGIEAGMEKGEGGTQLAPSVPLVAEGRVVPVRGWIGFGPADAKPLLLALYACVGARERPLPQHGEQPAESLVSNPHARRRFLRSSV